MLSAVLDDFGLGLGEGFCAHTGAKSPHKKIVANIICVPCFMTVVRTSRTISGTRQRKKTGLEYDPWIFT